MPRKPNYSFERSEREKAKKAKKAERLRAKSEKSDARKDESAGSNPEIQQTDESGSNTG